MIYVQMNDPDTDRGVAAFQSTLWTLVLRAKNPTEEDRRRALDELISIYWKPAYFFLRRRGLDIETAKDVAQGFFTAFLEKNFLRTVEREKGRFRTFLLACLEHHLSDVRDRERAQKRGGGRRTMSLDFIAAEREMPADPNAGPPEAVFDRAWAVTLLGRALGLLRKEFARDGKKKLFDALKAHVARDADTPYTEAAEDLGMTEAAVRVAVHRARKRYGELVRAEVRRTVESDEAVEAEIGALLEVLK